MTIKTTHGYVLNCYENTSVLNIYYLQLWFSWATFLLLFFYSTFPVFPKIKLLAIVRFLYRLETRPVAQPTPIEH